jgi:hypothetical protein
MVGIGTSSGRDFYTKFAKNAKTNRRDKNATE